MMDKWTAKNGKMALMFWWILHGSVFIESYDATDSSTDSNKMFNLLAKTILKISKENIVQVVTNNVSENTKVGDMLKEVLLYIL